MLAQRMRLVMVCAGGCERVYRQMGGYPADIIGYYGMQSAAVKDGVLCVEGETSIVLDKADITAKVNALREQFGLTVYAGETVEFHDSGLFTFPILGTDAHLPDKLAYDPDRRKRRAMFEQVSRVFSEFNVFIGGSSSFDIAPKPFCKSYALKEYLGKHNIGVDQVIFFGDDYGLGGNDADVYNSGMRFVCIDDYRAFPETARKLLELA
jgi:hypothetical protein